jgi:pyruvate kinase
MKDKKRRTKIVATIGPSCDDPETLYKMVLAGMDVARFNFSHGTHEEHGRRIKAVREAAARCGKRVGIMLDTRGPEVRLGLFQEGSAELKRGSIFTLRNYDVLGTSEEAEVSLKSLPGLVKKGSTILLDDGNIRLKVIDCTDDSVITEVQNDGVIKDRKKVSLPGCHIDLPAADEKDRSDIAFGASLKVDFVAASFIRTADDVREIRKLLEESGSNAAIISKIECQEGVRNLSEILQESDGLMVARGDLGVEYPVEEIPILQKLMIRMSLRSGKPVITATQMLESMIEHPTPTRAEASDVANAIFDGTDAVMLSGETASGRYPVLAVEFMSRIAARAEEVLAPEMFVPILETDEVKGVDEAVSHSAVNAARELSASAIVTPTASGYTARMVARFRPKTPIFAVTSHEETFGRLTLVWGVNPVLTPVFSRDSSEDLDILLNDGYIKEGDLCVITRGVPPGVPRTTNSMEIRTAHISRV